MFNELINNVWLEVEEDVFFTILTLYKHMYKH